MASTNRTGPVRCGRGGWAVAALAGLANAAGAQCEEWAGLGIGSQVRAFVAYDEPGAGPAVFAGGSMALIGSVNVRGVGRLRDGVWSQVGTNVAGGGVTGVVNAIAVYDADGPGPEPECLYVGGNFTSADNIAARSIARWDGATWAPVGPVQAASAIVNSLIVYDADGTGPGLAVLIASGGFSSIGNTPANAMARWDGASWAAMDTGTPVAAKQMVLFDEDGAGPGLPTLYAGAAFVGTSVANALVRWNGVAWEPAPMQPYDTGRVEMLVAFDPDGTGPASDVMYAGRGEIFPGESAVMRRNPDGSWSPLGPYLEDNGQIGVGCAYDRDGAGPGNAVLVTGYLNGGIGQSELIQYDGNAWSTPGGAPTSPGLLTGIASVVDHSGVSGAPAASLFVGAGPIGAGNGALTGQSILRVRGDRSEIALSAPAFVTAEVGGSAGFHVDAESSGTVITFAWTKNGEALVDGGNISGAATDTLEINPVSEGDKGIYECVVATDCAQNTTRPALLDVPAVDACPVDTNGDDVIDFLDLNGVLSLFGLPCP